MSDNKEILDFLRVRFDRVDTAIAELKMDVGELKTRVGRVERSVADLHVQNAEMSVRLDRLAERIERHDRRFDTVEALSLPLR